MRITMIGTGYVGLVTGACLAELGHTVTCLDIDEEKIARLSSGRVPIFEPGIEELVGRNTAAGRLSFSAEYSDSIPGAEAVFIAVGTPSADTGKADLSQVDAAVESLAKHLTDGTTVVMKSTVPTGTSAAVAARLLELRPDLDISVASNPEFLRQGAAVEDFMNPDRIVVGSSDERGAHVVRTVYQPLLQTGSPGLFTSIETSELIKYASNAFLAIKLSFVNEMADLCEQTGASISDVATGMGLDTRIGNRFLAAGPGFGGSCFPKDIQALLHTSQVHGAPSRVVAAAVDINRERKQRMVAKIAAALGNDIAGKTIAALGLTFKANTDDLRESPAIDIVQGLVGQGATVRAYDPQGMEQAKSLLPSVEFARSSAEAIDGVDAVVVLTEWSEFATLDLGELREAMSDPVLIDLRNLYEPGDVSAAGITYHSVGRAPTQP
jgi:UDPglucose 6-dehydrogenase